MGKVIQRQIQGMSWWMKTSLVLLLTLATTVFMYEGWYKPKQAQAAITVVTTALVNSGATMTTGVALTIPTTAANKMLVVGLSVTTSAAVTQTATMTYGGVAMTAVPNTHNGATSSLSHTYWFYLPENAVMDNTSRYIVPTVTGGTVVYRSLWYATYAGVQQVAPGGAMMNSGTTSQTAAALSSGLVINTGDTALDIVNLTRSTSMTVRTITWATNWAIGPTAVQTGGATNGVANYMGASSTASASDTAAHTASGTTMIAASGMVIPMMPPFAVGNGTDPSSGNAYQGGMGYALDAFTLKMGTGTGTVNTLTFTGSTAFTSSNISSIKVYRDNAVVGVLDGSDVLVPTTTGWAANVATITFTTGESVTTTEANYLVVVDVQAAATQNASLSGLVTAATGTGLTGAVYDDTSSASLTVKGAGLYVSDSTGVVNATARQSSIDNAMNGFTLFMGVGSSTVNTLTLTGSAQFTATNVAAIRVYHDIRTIGKVDPMDTLIPTSTAWAGNVATITFTTPEAVTTTAVPYLIAVDLTVGAVATNTLSGRITAVTGTGIGTPTYSDSTTATLTVAAGTALTVGNGTNPANASAPAVSMNNAIDSFTLSLAAAARAKVATLTLTGNANLTSIKVTGIRVFADNGVKGTLDRQDQLIPSTYTHTGTAPVITFVTPELVTDTAKSYLIVVDVNTQNSVTVADTLTATVSAVTGTGIFSTTYSDTTSATLTVSKSNFQNNSCSGCHGYGGTTSVLADGTASNTPPGTVAGSHGVHNGLYQYACSDCHSAPATTTSADYGHSRGTITMANPIHAETGAAYGKGLSWSVVNPPAAGQACSSTYCHSQGTGATGQAGDTRTLSAPTTSLNWGTTAADSCDSCHGYPPNYANGATTWGAAKANSHSAHSTNCAQCHNRTTINSVIVNPAMHVNNVYNVMSSGAAASPRGSFTYTYGVAGGTCANIACHGGTTAVWGTTVDCTNCHGVALSSPVAASIDATVTTRRAVTPEFTQTWSHKRSGGKVATKWDCIVCHMEGDPDTGKTAAAYHANGYIELRDPDTGDTIHRTPFNNAATPTAAGRYFSNTTTATFVRFSKNYAATRPEVDANFWTQAAIQNNLCLKCHDRGGAASPLARVPGGTALKPFATTVTNQAAPYPSYFTANAGSVLNVFTSFSSGNASYHPVRHRANNSFIKNAMMQTTYALATDKTGTNTTSWGILITCWDCHGPAGVSGTSNLTVTAHGGAVTLRSPTRAAGTTVAANLCLVCHKTAYSTQAGFHGTGSAFVTGSNSMDAATMANCHYCHGYTVAAGTVSAGTRPLRAEDAHGVNDRTAGTAGSRWATSQAKPFAFFRGPLTNWAPNVIAAANNDGTALVGTKLCAGTNGTCNNGMGSYTVGGTF